MAGLAKTGAIALSLAVNAGLLALLVVEDRRPTPRRGLGHSPLYIKIEPVIIGAKDRKAQASAPQAQHQRRAPARSRDSEAAGPAPAVTPTSDHSAAPAYDPRWTVRPSHSPDAAWPAGNAARNDGPDCRPTSAPSSPDRQACRALAIAAEESSPPMARSGDEERTAGFAKQAAVKKRWRDYREGDGAYPGLRSLFGMN
ncbi:hypothetical protein HNP47_001012 [Brevundimonas vesicularis]|uniref:Uncharacterized protein n=1 Tax=Brevundimonas vesicularis TaxID=41276 RepID=A0A7W9L577_BREVE|nr:hypothetical protein [Brevundimonas vesicularis]MBB5771043.1 hypothetical protein [Brevundimonas vesicularis]